MDLEQLSQHLDYLTINYYWYRGKTGDLQKKWGISAHKDGRTVNAVSNKLEKSIWEVLDNFKEIGVCLERIQ